MPTAKHFVIGCLIALILGGVLVVVVVGGIFFLGLYKFGDTAEAEGVEFGRHTDQQGCQNEALRRFRSARKAENPITSQAAVLFINGCFQTCRDTAGFCRNAPQEDSFLTVRKWAQERCRLEDAWGDDACRSLFMEVSDACFGKIKRK